MKIPKFVVLAAAALVCLDNMCVYEDYFVKALEVETDTATEYLHGIALKQ